MSQVRKLQKGGNTPKEEKQYGHLWVDGIDLGNSEEVYNAFANYAKNQALNQGKFYDQWLTALRNGQDVVFGNGNTVNLKPEGMSEKRAGERSNWRRFWDDTFNTERNQFSDAVATARRFTYTKPSETKSVKEYDNYHGVYDWDTKDGKSYYSNNPGNLALDKRFEEYLNWLEDTENWESANKFKNVPTDARLAGLKAWWDSMANSIDENDTRTQRERAKAYIDDYLARMRKTDSWKNVDEGIKEFLDYFNIGETDSQIAAAAAAEAAAQQAAAAQAGTYNGNVANGSIQTGKQTGGRYNVFIGDGNNGFEKGAVYTTMPTDPNRPYLITPERLGLFDGLDDSFIDAVVWNNRIWKQPEFIQNEWLRRRMKDVTRENKSATNSADMFARVSPLLNYTDDEENKYVDYNRQTAYRNDTLDPNKAISYQAYLRGKILAEQLAEGNYALSDPTGRYLTNGDTIYEVYDFNNVGEGNYGFRKPFYLIFDESGNLKATTEDPNNYHHASISYADSGKNPMSMSNFRSWENINGKDYGLLTNVWGADAHDQTPYQIYEDRDGNFYTKRGDGNMVPLDKDLVMWIMQDQNHKPNHNQMLNGTLSGDKAFSEDEFNTLYNKFINYPNTRPAAIKELEKYWWTLTDAQRNKINSIPRFKDEVTSKFKNPYYKNGGKFVKPRELPKYQYGGKSIAMPTEASQLETQETPLRSSSNVWETLTPADKKEITAAAIDVAGAIAGLTGPVGSVAGAVTGLGSTGLFMSAAKERKGSLDAGDWGQAALATGLDIVSLIPYLGETGKIAKIGKAVTRVAVPLGRAFSALGLVEAASVIKKNPKDWDTNDLLKLSAGLQAVIGIGHRTYQKAGESAVAHEISKIRGNKPIDIQHKYKIGDTDVELTAQEIEAISNPKNNSEEILKGILQGRGIKDEQLKDMPTLLDMFGFDTSKKGWFRGRHTVATAKKPEQPDKYSKYGYLADITDLWGSRELKRRAYIDANMKNEKVRTKLDELIAPMDKTKAHKFRYNTEEIDVQGTRRPINRRSALARGYAESQARIGEIPSSFIKYARINDTPEDVVTVSKVPTQEFVAEDVIAHPGVRTPYVAGPTERTLSMTGTKRNPAGKEPGIKNTNASDWAADLNDQQIISRFGRADKQQVIDLLNVLPEERKASIIESLRKSNSEKIRSVLRELGERPLRSKQSDRKIEISQRKRKRELTEKLENLKKNTSSLYNPREIRGRKNAQEEARQVAKNIKALQQSKDPMATLRQLSSENPNFDQRVYDNPERFRAAVETSFNLAWGNKKPRFIKEKRAKLEQLIEDLNLLMKNGGKIIKAQKGNPGLTYTSPLITSPYYFGYKSLEQQRLEELQKDVAPLFKTVKLDAPTPSTTVQEPQKQDDVYDTKGAIEQNYSDPNIDSKPYWESFINGGLSALDYGAMAWGRRKVHDQIERGLKNSLFKEVTPVLNGVSVATPYEDSLVAKYNDHVRRGLTTPFTSDNVANTSGVLTQQQNGLTGLDQATRQQSQAAFQREQQNQQIRNQQAQLDANAQNNFLARVAGLRMNLAQNDASLTTQTAQSIQNLAREWRTKFNETSQKANRLMYQKAASDLSDASERAWNQHVGSDLYGEWSKLTPAQQAEYMDMNDWIQKNHADKWTNLSNDWDLHQRALNEQTLDLYSKYLLDDPYAYFLYRQRFGTLKSGGKVGKGNRYKNEPWEDIWIEQNKASHKAVAKLNDNIIKTFLKTLK